ncbi:hypothetical protein [Marilutibacter alkalisoli]|uniref:Uncharacterized protein n=1 Tax=Marilutibacter alkalisoli TaxID=2591633 RepID=A0A514BS95_9GAMM|nr:hypothetical protein [Lysobacter alkalisoli]QDH70195.1 hypothetical protein FKV23_08880 [Lysobacter alkalisoli]
MSKFKVFSSLVVMVAALTFPVGDAQAQSLFKYTSQQGDYIGLGTDGQYDARNARFTLHGNAGYLTLVVDGNDGAWWHINLAAPSGQTFRPGRYYHAERAPFRTGLSPGVDVGGNGRGCNETWGSVFVRQIETNEEGEVTALEARFTQRCEQATAPALSGLVRYNASPKFLHLVSEPGDYIGGGINKAYFGDTSVFTVSGTNTYLHFAASGQRDDWWATIAPPTGQKLRKGTYETARFADESRAGLDFSGNGRGCNNSSGELTITSIVTNEQGEVTKLNASFEQHCESGAAALRGVIRYHH